MLGSPSSCGLLESLGELSFLYLQLFVVFTNGVQIYCCSTLLSVLSVFFHFIEWNVNLVINCFACLPTSCTIEIIVRNNIERHFAYNYMIFGFN